MTTCIHHEPLFRAAGDQAIIMEIGTAISLPVHQRIRAMMQALEHTVIDGMIEFSPDYRSITVLYDPLRTTFLHLQERLLALYSSLGPAAAPAAAIIELPVCYGGAFGPDLAFVAEHHGLSEQEVIALHSAPDYLVYMLGFSPGFPFLGGLPEILHTPRLESPRKLVPAGSVGIANGQTGVYPVASPGGWRLIGRTPVRLFDPVSEHPFLLSAGNILRFKPISEEEYQNPSSW